MSKGLQRSLKNLYQSLGRGVPTSGSTSDDQGIGAMRKEVITLTNFVVVLVDNAGVVAHGGTKVMDLTEGAILIQGCVADLALTLSAAGVNADWDGDFGIGTVVADTGNTLTGTEENIVPSTATPQATSSATTAKGESTSTESGTIVDGTTTAVDVFLNILIDDADHDVTGTPTNIIVNGTINLFYTNLGDN